MTLAFIPLIPGSLGKAEASGAARLKPMSANFEPTKTVAEPETPHVHRDPKITLERQGETITHIRVECGCGQVIELKCEY